jgi:tRNA modification GTPase
MSVETPTSRASVLTPVGRGAVAVVAAEGSAAMAVLDKHFRAANGRYIRSQTVDRVVFGHWQTVAHSEEVVVVRTAEEALEIHCHGGVAAFSRIATALADAGCEIVPWKKWSRGEQFNAIQVEADLALANAATQRTAASLLHQRSGVLQRALMSIEERLSAGERDAATKRIEDLLSRCSIGLHLTKPWQVAIAGRPNVGKSSLINALAGYQRAIVFNEPGTTRDVLAVETAIDGWPVRLTDAAGLRDAGDVLEAEGVARAREQLRSADLVLWVFELSRQENYEAAVGAARQEAAAEFQLAARTLDANLLLVGNKVDLLKKLPTDKLNGVVLTSALRQLGIDDLLAAISTQLVPIPPEPNQALPFTPRQVKGLDAARNSLRERDFRGALAHIAQLSAASV